MKKVIKAVETNLYEFLGEEVVTDRSVGFRITVAVLLFSVTVFVLINLVLMIF